MAEILSFGAMHYNPSRLGVLDELLAPPLDAVSAEMETRLKENPYNFLHLSIPGGDKVSRYRNAMHKIFSWLLRDIMLTDKLTKIYLYRQKIRLEEGFSERTGFISLMKVEEYGNQVRRLETAAQTLVEDGLGMLKETQIDLEPVTFLYRDSVSEISKTLDSMKEGVTSIAEGTDSEGNTHSILRIEDEVLIASIIEKMKEKNLYIIDGQYRYAAALKYQTEMKEQAGAKYNGKETFNFVPGVFFQAENAGVFLPGNRVINRIPVAGVDLIKGLDQNYKVAVLNITDPKMEKAARKKIRIILQDHQAGGLISFGLYIKAFPNKYFVVTLKDPKKLGSSEGLFLLDTVVLQNTILSPILGISGENTGGISIETNDNLAFDCVKNGQESVVFLLNAPKIQKLLDISDKNQVIPVKTSVLYPRLPGGLVMYSMRYSPVKA
jgi:uncharacterized protein (DUF1015 family)